MKKTKGFMAEFKQFINKGNVMDMAVGIIIGTAFTAIVNSLVKDIIMPFIGIISGGIDLSALKLVIKNATATTAEVAICYGTFIQSIVNFLIIALVVFIMVKGINKLNRRKEKKKAAKPEEPSKELVVLTEIRDLLKNN